MTSRDYGFTTLRNVTVYNQDGSLVTPGYVYTVGTGGKQVFTNSISLSSLTVSSINGIPYTSSQDSNWTYNSTTSTLSSNSPNVNVTNFSTNSINMTNGTISGVSTINGLPFNPSQDIHWTYNSTTSTLSNDIGIVQINNNIGTNLTTPVFVVSTANDKFYINNNYDIDTKKNGITAYIENNDTDDYGASFNFKKSKNGGVTTSGSELGYVSFYGTDGVNSSIRASHIISIQDGISTGTGSGKIPGSLQFVTSDGTGEATRMTIASNGKVGIGETFLSTTLDVGGYIGLSKENNSSISNYIWFGNKRSTGNSTINGDELGGILFMGTNTSTTSTLDIGTSIRTFQDGDSGQNFVPGRMEFWTTLSTNGNYDKRMTIGTDGNVRVNSTFYSPNINTSTLVVSTINGLPFDPTQDTHWTYNSSLNTLTNNIGNVNINGYTISSTVPILNVSTNTNRFYVLNNSTSATYNGISIHLDNNQTDPFSGALRFAKTQNFNSTTDSCELGYITFEGTDTNKSTLIGSRIITRQDGNASAGSIAGSLYFDTNAGGSLAYTRMKILSGGNIEMYSSLKVYNNLITSSIGSTSQRTTIYGDVYIESQGGLNSSSLNLFNNKVGIRTNSTFSSGCYLELRDSTVINNQFNISNDLGLNIYATFGQSKNEVYSTLTVSSLSTLSTCISINPNSTVSGTSGGILEAYNSNNTVKKPMYINPYGGHIYLGSTSYSTIINNKVCLNSQSGNDSDTSLYLFNNKAQIRTNNNFFGGVYLEFSTSVADNDKNFKITEESGVPIYAEFGKTINQINNTLTINNLSTNSTSISINPNSTISGISGGIIEVYSTASNTLKKPIYINPYGGDVYLGSITQSTIVNGTLLVNGPSISRVAISTITSTNFTIPSSMYGKYIFMDGSIYNQINSFGTPADQGTIVVIRNTGSASINVTPSALVDSTGSTINANRTASYVYYGTGWYGL